MNKPALKAKKTLVRLSLDCIPAVPVSGVFNIMFAWLGLIFFLVPLATLHCHRIQALLQLLLRQGTAVFHSRQKLHLSPNREIPGWMKSKHSAMVSLYSFLVMFRQMLFNTYLVFRGTSGLKQAVTVLGPSACPGRRLSRHRPSPVDCPVCLWLLQRHADLHHLGLATNGPVPPLPWCVYAPHGVL